MDQAAMLALSTDVLIKYVQYIFTVSGGGGDHIYYVV